MFDVQFGFDVYIKSKWKIDSNFAYLFRKPELYQKNLKKKVYCAENFPIKC